MRIFFLSALLFSLEFSVALSQTVPPLERKISISYQDTPMDDALVKLSQVGNFIFSYNPTILNSSQILNGAYSDTPVRELLNELLGESIDVNGRGNYIILKKATPPTKKEIVKKTVTISGYVTDRKTGAALAEVSVYDKKSFTAVISNEFGYYTITVDNEDLQTVLFFNKRAFRDTLFTVKLASAQFIDIRMTPELAIMARFEQQPDRIQMAAPISTRLPEVGKDTSKTALIKFRNFIQNNFFARNIFSRKKGDVNISNIKDTLTREVQVSLLPFVGTNHKLSGNVINRYSFNVLGGYSLGTTNAELGGLFNIDRGDVSHAQMAGLFNTVGGRMSGLQVAGYANLNRRKATGIQFAGLTNLNLDSAKAAQFAGLFNLNWRASEGVQFAGLFNVQPSHYKGSQFAGLFNVATHQMKGTQTAGLLNFAHHIQGLQIGLFNYADSIHGIPLGLISVVSHGYHKIELSTDEIFYSNLSFRTGVRQFYNILNAGMKPETWKQNASQPTTAPTSGVWSLGYGIGTAPKVAKWLFLNFDFTTNHVNKGSFTNSISSLNKIYLGFDFQLARKFSITAGATFNAYLSDPTYSDNPVLFTDFSPTIINEQNFSNGTNMKMWWGAKVGIRFL